AELGETLQAGVAPLEISTRARDNVAHVDRLARFGIGHEARGGGLMLQIEESGEGARGARQGGMGGAVAHALAADPDLAIVLEVTQEVLAGARGHGRLLRPPPPTKLARAGTAR